MDSLEFNVDADVRPPPERSSRDVRLLAPGLPSLRYMKRPLALAIAVSIAFGAACEDMPAGPDAVEAITRSQDLGGAGLSLRDLFTAAMFRMQREEGTDTAISVLREWREVREDSTGAVDVRNLEASTVVRAFGDGVVDQAAAVVSGELHEASLAAERVMSVTGDVPEARSALDSAARAIAGARALRPQSAERALLALDDAAQQLARLRVSLVDADRFPTLDELYARALETDGADVPFAQAAESELVAGVEKARTEEDVNGHYTALEALRRHRAAIVVNALGEEIGRRLLVELDAQIARLASALDEGDERNSDVLVDRRMLDTVTQIRDRALAAMDNGEPAIALDLATHAAGLLDEIRRRRAR